jgi:hypothetical protein
MAEKASSASFFVEICLVAFAPLVFLLDLLHFLLGEVIFDVEVLKERLISWFLEFH